LHQLIKRILKVSNIKCTFKLKFEYWFLHYESPVCYVRVNPQLINKEKNQSKLIIFHMNSLD
jgi:hypothetical protein